MVRSPTSRSTGRSGIELGTAEPFGNTHVDDTRTTARRVLVMAPGSDVDARCSQCGHPQREHRGQNPCSVPQCACSGYLPRDVAPGRTKKRS